MVRTKEEILTESYGTTSDTEVLEIITEDYNRAWYGPPREHWTKLQLPYEAPGHPGLPSLQEIRSAFDDDSNKLTQPGGLRPVWRVGKLVVKCYMSHEIIQEAENLIYLREHTKVRVPKLYAVFEVNNIIISPSPRIIVITEFIEGFVFNAITFPRLDQRDQDIIRSRLGEQLQLLRSVKQPGDSPYYGRIHHQGLNPVLSCLRRRPDGMSGPFDSYEELVDELYKSIERVAAMDNPRPDFSDHHIIFLDKFKRILNGPGVVEPTLTHLDASLKNVISRPIKDRDGKTIDWEITLVDWDTMAWMPPYFQYLCMDNAKEEWDFYTKYLGDEGREKADFLRCGYWDVC